MPRVGCRQRNNASAPVTTPGCTSCGWKYNSNWSLLMASRSSCANNKRRLACNCISASKNAKPFPTALTWCIAISAWVIKTSVSSWSPKNKVAPILRVFFGRNWVSATFCATAACSAAAKSVTSCTAAARWVESISVRIRNSSAFKRPTVSPEGSTACSDCPTNFRTRSPVLYPKLSFRVLKSSISIKSKAA